MAEDYIEQCREALRNIAERTNEIREDWTEEVESVVPGLFDQIEAVSDWAEHVLASADPTLVSPGAFSDVLGTLNDVAQNIANVPSNAESYAPNVRVGLDNVVMETAPLAVVSPPVRKLAGTASQLGRRVGSRLESLSGTADQIEQRLAELGDQAEQRDAERQAEQEQQVATLQQQLEQLQQAINAETDRITTTLAQFEATFQESETARGETFETTAERLGQEATEFKDALKSEADDHTDALTADAEKHREQLESRAQEALDRIEEIRAKVESLYEVIFKAGTASAFSKEAKDEREHADNWRYIALAFGVAAIAVAVYTAFRSETDDLSVERLIARLAVAVAFGGVAAYAGQQSGRHRRREEDAKQLELDLTAIGPFVEEIDETKRDAVRQIFVERWMATRTNGSKNSEPEDTAVPSVALAKAAVDLVTKQGQQ